MAISLADKDEHLSSTPTVNTVDNGANIRILRNLTSYIGGRSIFTRRVCEERESMGEEELVKRSIIDVLKRMGYRYLGSYLWIEGPDHQLEDNFREHFSTLNADRLGGRSLTPSEWERVLNEFPRSVADAFTKFRNGITISRDDGSGLNLIFFDRVHPERNVFEVADEVRVINVTGCRFDIVTFVNGIPFSNIELKRKGVALKEALTQINKYTGYGLYKVGLMRFVQFFVISDSKVTKYFSVSPLSDMGTKYGTQTFRWTDDHNEPVQEVCPFVADFYRPEMVTKILHDYMLMVGDNAIVILRPYQIYAAEAAFRKVESGENCFIWHATGSGKTLTSFVLARSLVEGESRRKVVLLLDRNDLASQTMSEYAKFDDVGIIEDDISRGKKLRKAMRDTSYLTVTTIQSFSNSAEEMSSTKPVVFIIDECHRTTFGSMFANIRRHFDNAVFVGFTGTPILSENAAVGDRTTMSMFGDPAHIYTIKNAIDDGNVLKFSLRPCRLFESGVDSPEDAETPRFSPSAMVMMKSAFIAENLRKHTKQVSDVKDASTRGFSAILAADSIETAFDYYNILRDYLRLQNRKVGIVFSPDDNTEGKLYNGTHEEWYLRILHNHDADFGTSYEAGARSDFQGARSAHVADVIARVKSGEIDLVVVSDMLLTGFDAPSVNTIYLDKSLTHHRLLQAMSRTNRLADGKNAGIVVLFEDRNMKEDVDTAIIEYSNGDAVDNVIDPSTYAEVLAKLTAAVKNLKAVATTPEKVESIRDADTFRTVAKAYGKVRSLFGFIQSFTEWNDSVGLSVVGTSRDELDSYYSFLMEAREHIEGDGKEDDDDEDSVDLEIKPLGEFVIDVAYINELLRRFVAAPPAAKEKWLRECERALAVASGDDIEKNREAVVNVLGACRRGEIGSRDELADALTAERIAVYNRRIERLSEETGVDADTLRRWVQHYIEWGQPPEKMIETIKHDVGTSFKGARAIKGRIERAVRDEF